MNEEKDIELLIEISKLLKRFGPETFDKLSENLAKPEFSERLVSVLTIISRTSKSLPSQIQKKTKLSDFRSKFVESMQSEPEKLKLLLDFYDNLVAKTILPTMKEVRFFTEDVGLNQLKTTDRQKSIYALIKQLSILSIDEITRMLVNIKTVNSIHDRSLEGWSNIILNSNTNESKKNST